jgi:hypothetical protein
MPRDNHPRERQARALARRKPKRPPFDRVLIVTEGCKTEFLYFEDIRKQRRISSAHFDVLHSKFGTEPLQIVDFAHKQFLQSKEFECVFAVFDRDTHGTYFDALARVRVLDKKLRNDAGKFVRFFAVPSVPCFELWLLLHFQDQFAPLHHSEAIQRLKQFIPTYNKGATYALTEPKIEEAIKRAANLRRQYTADSGTDPYTDVDTLVARLRAIRLP